MCILEGHRKSKLTTPKIRVKRSEVLFATRSRVEVNDLEQEPYLIRAIATIVAGNSHIRMRRTQSVRGSSFVVKRALVKLSTLAKNVHHRRRSPHPNKAHVPSVNAAGMVAGMGCLFW